MNGKLFTMSVIKVGIVVFLSLGICGLAHSMDAEKLEEEIAAIASHSKMANQHVVENALRQGEKTVRVIVELKRSDEIENLSNRSHRAQALKSGNLAALQNLPYTPKQSRFFDLKDQSIRNELAAAVKNQLDAIALDVNLSTNTININQQQAVAITKRFKYVSGFAAQVTPEGLQWLLDNDDVQSVSYDLEVELHGAQGIPVINATNSRNEFSGSGVAIAIVDDGIQTSHPDLGGTSSAANTKTIGGFDFADNDSDFTPTGSHGTAVAGIAAGDANVAGDYIGGVAPDAKLYGLKVFSNSGGGGSFSDIIDAWEWAVTHKNDDVNNPILVINSSLGLGDTQFTSECDSVLPALTQAADNLWSAGISNFVSSGNDGFCGAISFPSCISTANSIGAIYDANIGATGWCVSQNSCVTKQANGACPSGFATFADSSTTANKVTAYSNVSTDLMLFASSHNSTTAEPSGNYTSNFGGTSAASPYAAGAAAVLQHAANEKMGRYLTPQEVRDYLVNNGTDIIDNRDTPTTTKPKVNLDAAVAAIPDLRVPDLSIETQSVSDSFVMTSSAFTLSSSVRNSSTNQASPATTIRLFNSTDEFISTSDIEIATQPVSALAAQSSESQSTWSLTAPATNGVYYYGFCVDTVIGEVVVDNNCSENAIQLTVNGTGDDPDLDLLVFSQSVDDGFATPSQNLNFTSVIRNDGLSAATPTTLSLYMSTDQTIESSDTLISSSALAALAAETNSANNNFSVNAPNVDGIYYYGFCVDSIENESDESNNCGTAVTVEVNSIGEDIMPDLMILNQSVDDLFAEPNQALMLTTQLRNIGLQSSEASTVRFYSSTDDAIEMADTELSNQVLPALAAGADSTELNWNLNAPLMNGTYYYGFCVDSVSEEVVTANNCSSAIEITVNEDGLEPPQDDICFPIKAANGNIAVICL